MTQHMDSDTPLYPPPVIRRRECGGWLANSPSAARFRIGVTAQTEQDAVGLFQMAWRDWSETLANVE